MATLYEPNQMEPIMSRTFAYCRVSTGEQTTDNQVLALQSAGFDVQPTRVVSETVSGSVPAMERKAFANLITNQMEAGDTLVVLKLDRLGRDNIDVQLTIKLLEERGIKLVCLDLPVTDLSTDVGKLMLQLVASFAEFERGRIRERTKEGQARAVAEGKKIGRPTAIGTNHLVQGHKHNGLSQAQVAEKTGLSLSTVKRNWKPFYV